MAIYIKNICLARSVRSACPFLRVTGAGQLEGVWAVHRGVAKGSQPVLVLGGAAWGEMSMTPEDWGPFCHFSSVGRTGFLKEI